MAQMPESQGSSEGDDDKVYLFFNEAALEYDSYSKLVVSRVARVCKVLASGQTDRLPVPHVSFPSCKICNPELTAASNHCLLLQSATAFFRNLCECCDIPPSL